MQKDTIFALKIENADLEEVDPVDLASLLSNFSKALGSKDVSFQSIKSGSIYIENKTLDVNSSQKISNLSRSVDSHSSAVKAIEKVLSKYPHWGSACLIVKHIDEDYECAKKLHVIDAPAKALYFSQPDTFRGRFLGVHEGLDATDHGSLLLDGGKKISFALSPELAKTMNHFFRSEALIEVSGQAKYAYFDYKNIILQSFFVESFSVVEEGNISEWIKDFVSAGTNGWSAFENPVKEWLKDRRA